MLENLKNGWYELSAGYEVLIEHGLPVRLMCAGGADLVEPAQLADEIRRLSGFSAHLGPWGKGEAPLDRVAPLALSAAEFDAVLNALAKSSAASFFDRYFKPIGPKDSDFEDESYARDFAFALGRCGLGWAEVDKDDHRGRYLATLRAESKRLSETDGAVEEP